jgi:DNA-binding CsgD family transcriptional regulator
MMVIFFFIFFGNVCPRSVKKSDGLAAPKNLFVTVLLWTGMSCCLILFGNAVAEGTRHGVSLLYLSSAVSCTVVYPLWKKFGITPFRSLGVFVAMGAMGFILAIASLYAPVLRLAACVFLGAGSVCCTMGPLFGVLLAKQYPSRFISPAIIGTALIAVMAHSGLLDVFRGNEPGLYIAYLVIAVGLVIIYLMLEPYLLYSFRGRTLQDILGVVAEETEEETAGPQAAKQLETAPVKRASLLVKTETPGPIMPKDVSLHERHMKILMTHAISPLTNREYQLADCIMRGLRRSEIAQEMGIEPDSITKYSNRIYNKFGIHRRQDLFKLAEKLEREWKG